MKLKYLAIASLGIGLALTSCNGTKGSDKPISDYKNLTEMDSLAYYLGEMYAAQYYNLAQQDSTFSKEDFIKGIETGIDAIKDNEAYNRGIMMGIQFAMQSRAFKEEMETSVNHSMFLNGLTYALSGDSVKDATTVQTKMQEITARIAKRAQEKADAEAKRILSAAAKKKGYKEVDGLYVKIATPGEGETLKPGYEFTYTMKVVGADGKAIEQFSQPGEQKGILNRTIPMQTSMGQAVKSMKPGETASFLFTADQFLNGNAKSMKLDKNDVLTLTISIGKVVTPVKEDNATVPTAPIRVTPKNAQ